MLEDTIEGSNDHIISEETGETSLVIGDPHVDETQNLRRFRALGNFIIKHKPDNVILMGDFLTLNCFCQWDVDKRKKMEGLRRSEEIAAGNEALDLMLSPIIRYNQRRKKGSKHKYNPRLVYIEGNHEDRERRYLEYNPELLGTIDYTKSLGLKDRGFIFVPYREYAFIAGTGFTHIPMNKLNKPIGGQRVMQNALQLHAHSVVFGHTHELKFDGEHRHGARHFNQVLNTGGFFEHIDSYAVGSKLDDWRGIILMEHYSWNRFDFSTIAIRNLLEKYL